MKLLKKNESKLPGAVKDIAIIVAGVAIVWIVLHFILDTGNPFYVVSSGSMIPTLNVDDVLVVRNGGSFDGLKLGDIIVFHRPQGDDKVIVHRVAEVQVNMQGDRVIRTKGDANPSSIPGTDFPIRKNDYIGKVVFVIPGAGLVTKIFSPPVNYIIIGLILIILFMNRLRKKNDRETSQPSSGGALDSSSSPPPPSSPSQPSSPRG